MRLRPFTASNLHHCADLLTPGFVIDEPLRRRLPEIWQSLNRSHVLLGSVIEDSTTPAGPPVGYGMSVFLQPAFVDECLRRGEPYLAAQVYAAIEAGRSPVRSVGDAARANAREGLDLLILQYWQQDIEPGHPRGQAIMAAGHTSFRLAHEGFRINRALWEAFTTQQAALLRAGGFLLKHDYGPPPGADPEACRQLMGLYRDDPESQVLGSPASLLFRTPAPRFAFSLAEQRLLHSCLLDGADQGHATGRSLNTVKKMWQSIYARVEEIDPEVLGVGGEAGDAESFTRGPEKRRHLLSYLRFHLDELRPLAKPRERTGPRPD
jgi:hypothetical protein